MNIRYETAICDKCNIEEKIYARIHELRVKLFNILKKKYNLPNNWIGSFENDEGENIIEKDIKDFEKVFQKKCIIFHYYDEHEMNLCEKHFKELLKGFES